MPLFGTFSSGSSRALGLRNGSPPLPPTILAPSDNVSAPLTGSGNTTNRINTTVSFTSTVTSFAIDRFEFKVDQLDSNDNIVVAGTYQTAASAGATSFLLSNLLTSTRYGLYMRTVDVAGLVSVPTSVVRFITAAEVAPTAPTPSISATALSVSITYAAGTAGTYSIGTREYSLHPTIGGTTTYVPFTGTVSGRTTRTDTGAALVPGTSYTVSFRYTASSPTTLPGSTASSSISTSGEVKNSAPSVTINSVSTTNIAFTRGTSGGGTYGVSYYEYVVTNSGGTWVRTGTMSTATTYLEINAGGTPGVAPDETFTVYVRAISLTSGTAGDYGNAGSRLNPPTPSAPTVSFTMSANSPGVATLNITKPAYATAAYVNIVGYGLQAATDQGSYFNITLYYQPYNQVIEYKAYVINRLNTQSSYGNSIYWTTPKKNQYWNSGYDNPDPTFFSTTASCASEFQISFGDVPATDDSVGYIRVTSASVSGIQAYEAYGIPTTANTGFLYWSIPNGGYEYNLTQTGFSPNWGTGSYTTRSITGLSIGGNSLDNQTWQVLTTLGSRTSGCAVNFTTSGGSYNVYKMKNFILEGVQTTGGSFS